MPPRSRPRKGPVKRNTLEVISSLKNDTSDPINVKIQDENELKISEKEDFKDVLIEPQAKRSKRMIKKREPFEETSEDELKKQSHRRQCEKTGCHSTVPICFVAAYNRCVGSGYTSRWHHITSGEHFCNECFDYFYRSYRGGNVEFLEWKKLWSSNSRLEASLKVFMTDRMLPIWAKCKQCNKWRQLNRNALPSVIINYSCMSKKSGSSCEAPEDSRVQLAKQPGWLQWGCVAGLLMNSPAASFLHQYYLDGVGLSPSNVRSKQERMKGTLSKYIQPFYLPGEQRKAFCFRPDVMEKEEKEAFPELCREGIMYLGIRNTILALWHQNPRNWLTYEELSDNLICRGITRIHCLEVARHVLNHMTLKGLVNVGLVQSPTLYSLLPQKKSVIVIGAGPSGLTAARHLQNLGLSVTVLEGRSRIGGRICDTLSLGGICVGLGAQILTGLINNPLTIMCQQGNLPLRIMGERCDLYTEKGELAASDADQRVDFHFNAILDSVSEWRKSAFKDNNLCDKLMQMHQTFSKDTGYVFSEEEECLLGFHLSNLEYACGSHLKYVSAINWDQNETFPQFAGHHALLTQGYSTLIDLLAQGLHINLHKRVNIIDYTSDDEVLVKTDGGDEYQCNYVLVSVPLAVLQNGQLQFNPVLNVNKKSALEHLGAGIIEKVGLHFSSCFWSEKLQGSDFFGHVPSKEEDRGLFSIFYDLTPVKLDAKGDYVLMTYLSGDAVNLVKNCTDQAVVDKCMNVLRNMFPNENVPEPLNWFVSHWQEDPFAGMAYSFIKVGGSGEDYDILSQDIQQRIYFAGEATNRQFPQTVTGAVLSGLREAAKIALDVYK